MNSFTKIGFSALICAVCFSPAIAAADSPAPPERYQDFDKVQMTRDRLDDLKAKLNLGDSQIPAWNAWSSRVISDVKELEKESVPRDWMAGRENLTIPERMQRQEDHLRSRIAWLQERLKRLEAARRDTGTFYAALTRDQRTIFDLFWERVFPHPDHGNFWKHHGGEK